MKTAVDNDGDHLLNRNLCHAKTLAQILIDAEVVADSAGPVGELLHTLDQEDVSGPGL